MAVRRTMPRAKKKKAPLPRRVKLGIGAAPTDSWRWFAEYIRIDLDPKDIMAVLKTYVKKNCPKVYLSVPDWHFKLYRTQAASILWKEKGLEFPKNHNHDATIAMWIEDIQKAIAKDIMAEENTSNKRSPAQVLRLKQENIIGSIEEVLDNGIYDPAGFSPYDELIKDNHAQSTAKAVVEYYKPILEEARELVEKKTPDLVEAFNHMSIAVRKKYLAFLEHIVADATRYMMAKKATRKVSVPRPKSAYSQIAKMNYAKESAEYKITSIDPLLIVGARRVWTFNTKYKHLTEFVSNERDGFTVKGSTLQKTDADRSRRITLRKPQEFLPIIQSNTQKQIKLAYSQLTTKSKPRFDGRINKDTLIMRVFEK
jgi:hypothetical protein